MPTRPAKPSHDLWQQAASFAAEKHEHQYRKDGVTPYISHPFRVAMTLRHVFGCDDAPALAAALLHDTIEDSNVDWDELEETFGRVVADCVGALTKNATLPEEEREVDYDRRLAAAGWRAHAIKLADCYDNFTDARTAKADAVRKVRGKCVRALKIAKDSDNPVVQRGAASLRALIGA